ncbi:MAG: hypothetical protein QXZ54_05860 [Candidatus Methanomethylicia archaeon]
MFEGFEWRTNRIRVLDEGGRRVLVKEFDVLKPALIFTLYNIACFIDSLLRLSIFRFEDYYFPSIKERIENELNGRRILREFNVKTPEVFQYDDKKIVMEFIDGICLLDFYREADLNDVYRFSRELGFKLRELHDHGFAYVDCRIENYILRGGEIYRLDLEFFTKATEFRRISDIVTYVTSILGLERDRCMTAIKAFHEGYGRKLTKIELTYTILFSSIYPLSLKEGPSELMNRTLNVYRLINENLKDVGLLKFLKSIF